MKPRKTRALYGDLENDRCISLLAFAFDGEHGSTNSWVSHH
jgi:hypothetical protein